MGFSGHGPSMRLDLWPVLVTEVALISSLLGPPVLEQSIDLTTWKRSGLQNSQAKKVLVSSAAHA